jgi:hypothetical protein
VENLEVSLTGPIDTPPSPNDIVFVGSVKSQPDTMLTLTTNPERTGVTSISYTDPFVYRCAGSDTTLALTAHLDPPAPIDPVDGTFTASFAIDSPLTFDPRGIAVDGTIGSGDTITGDLVFADWPAPCSSQFFWNALRKGATAPPHMQKLPPLQNLFLTRQGTMKIPPTRCVDSTDAATLTESISIPISGLDPKDPSQPRQLGGFSFQVKYDPLKVCVRLRPGAAWTNTGQVCTIEDSVTAPTLQGIARINCVTLGKATVVDTGDPAGRVLALIELRPQPEAYSQIRAGQDNGQVVQLNNEACKLTDLQGHAIEVFSCEDADVTIRFLEGDVEPDCAVNTLDTQAIAFRWGATKGGLVYNDRYNLEPSGTQADQDIDINDLQFVYGRFGSTCAAPWPAQAPVNAK